MQNSKDLNLKKAIQSVICQYSCSESKEYLTSPYQRSVTYREQLSIVDSILNIQNTALQGLQNKVFKLAHVLQEGDAFIFPDIHGRLDLFMQNLYVAGLINADGNWIAERKTCILLGDLISRGPYSAETVIYARTLQEQAKRSNSKFKILLGNHEMCLVKGKCINFYNLTYREPLAKILYEEIINENFQLAYANEKKHILCVHAGLEKSVLLRILCEIEPKLKDRLGEKRKISSLELMKVMYDNHISIEDVATLLNEKHKNTLLKNYGMEWKYTPWDFSESVFSSRKKIHRKDEYKIHLNKSYKINQFVGHTTTNVANHFPKATSFGAVKKINHTFYLDYDLLRGNMAFVTIRDREVIQVQYQSNGLKEGEPRIKNCKEVPENMKNTPGCYPDNTKAMNLSLWNVRHIGLLPSVEHREVSLRCTNGDTLKKKEKLLLVNTIPTKKIGRLSM